MDKIKLKTRRASIESPGVRTFDDIDFEMTTDEIRTVVGADGAGKSTLMKVLTGANSSYMEEVFLSDKRVKARTPADVKKLGIQIVHQEVGVALYLTLSMAEGIIQNDMVMGKSDCTVNWSKVYRQECTVLDRLHISRDQVDGRELVQNLSLAQKQMVLTTKAIRSECSFLVLDEPITPLDNTETGEPFHTVQHLRETENIAILFISHRLNEVLEICENYTVVRSGKIIGTTPVAGQTTTKEIMEKMLGRAFEENSPKEVCETGEMLFETLHLSGTRGKVKDVSIQVKSGEVVEITGLVDVGESEPRKTLFDAFEMTNGRIMPKSRELKIANPSGTVKNHMVLVPEERRKKKVLIHENVSFSLSAAYLS